MKLSGLRSSIEWIEDHLEVIDQTVLPELLAIRRLSSASEVVDAIRRLVVRGAPALGVAGAFGMVLGLDDARPSDASRARAELERLAQEIGGARPTGANLSWAARRVAEVAARGETAEEIRRLALAEAVRIQEEDQESCRRIAEFGRTELSSARRILTHCNTGRLATAGIGTALGIVYAKAEAGEPVEVISTETRPMLQGARLTAWELREAGIPVTLISDAAAGAAIADGRAEAVVVGCDRVARNGDTANKVGTLTLAVLAHSAGVPFYVAGPITSFDPGTRDGGAIVVEERPGEEVRRVGGTAVAPDVEVWNPAFDVTPADLITAFITNLGVLRPPFRESIHGALEEAGRMGQRGPSGEERSFDAPSPRA